MVIWSRSKGFLVWSWQEDGFDGSGEKVIYGS